MLILLPLIVAQPVYQQGTNVTISVPCTIGGQACSSSATCTATIINPDPLVLINNYSMTQNNAVFEVDLPDNQTEVNGEYELTVACVDGSRSRTKSLRFYITPNGEMPSTANGLLYIGVFAILIIFFILTIYGFLQAENLVIRMLVFYIGWLLLIAIAFISWNMSVNFLSSAPFLNSFLRIIFLFFVYGTFPLLLVSFVWVGYMMLTIKEIKQMMERGLSEDEAWDRKKGGRS